MAITKTTEEDRIEVITEYKHIQIRTATVIKEDDTELTRKFSRKCLNAGRLDASDNFVDTDISGESTEVKAIANAVSTQAVKDKYKAHMIANKPS